MNTEEHHDSESSKNENDSRQMRRRSFIRWIGGTSLRFVAASTKFDLFGMNGRVADAGTLAPEDSGFPIWGELMLVPADATPVAIRFQEPPTLPPARRRANTQSDLSSIDELARATGVTCYELNSEPARHPQVRWMSSGHPDQLGAILSSRDDAAQTDFRQVSLLIRPNIPTPYPVVAPPLSKSSEPGASWPPLETANFLGSGAVVTRMPDGLVVQWVHDHTYYLIDARDRRDGVELRTLERSLNEVSPG